MAEEKIDIPMLLTEITAILFHSVSSQHDQI